MVASGMLLVVDDNFEQRARTVAALEEAGHRVRVAGDGEAAVAAAVAERPDCMLVNASLPRLDGIGTCERIRTMPRGDEIAVIVVTSRRDLASFDRALAAGADDVVTRPFHSKDLIDRVRTALQWRSPGRNPTELDELLKRQRDRLQRFELARQQLIEFFVHDLKAPVNATDLYAQLIERCVDDRAAVLASANRIRAETRALAAMFVNLLDLSKADEGQLKPSLTEVDARSLVGDVLDELAIVARSSAVTIATEIRTTTIRGDRELLARVLANLIDNAIRYSPENGRVHVEIANRDQRVEIRVADEGPGIPAEQRGAMFDRFASAGKTTRWNRGLGLAFCKLAVESHGGEIWIEDGSVGAVFCVRI